METVIDIYNNILIYNKSRIDFIIDNKGNIWFKFKTIADILEYKSSKDVLRDLIDNINKEHIKNIKTIYKTNDHPDTIYITENGLYTLMIKSRMKNAQTFQKWIINNVLPTLREKGKYVLTKKIQTKLKNLNDKIKELQKNNKILKNNMAKKTYPKGEHIYVIKEDNMFKIGYTKNLATRLKTYNTGKPDNIDYVYYKKTKCGYEIEICLKSILHKYIYRNNREFYTCKLNKIISAISKCLIIEKKCIKCNQISKEQKGGGEISIIDKVLFNMNRKYNYFKKILDKLWLS